MIKLLKDLRCVEHKQLVVERLVEMLEGIPDECRSAGTYDYIEKPIDPFELNQMIAKWLPERNNS